MIKHLSINKDETCMVFDCHFVGNPFMEVRIDDEGNLCTDNGYNGDHASIDLTLEQVKELHKYLTGILEQAGEL